MGKRLELPPGEQDHTALFLITLAAGAFIGAVFYLALQGTW